MSDQYDTTALEAGLRDLAVMYRTRTAPDGWEYTDEGRLVVEAADALAQQRSDLARLQAERDEAVQTRAEFAAALARAERAEARVEKVEKVRHDLTVMNKTLQNELTQLGLVCTWQYDEMMKLYHEMQAFQEYPMAFLFGGRVMFWLDLRWPFVHVRRGLRVAARPTSPASTGEGR